MERMNDKETKIAMFFTALTDCYRSEEDRELQLFTEIEIDDSYDFVDDLDSIVSAIKTFVNEISEEKNDSFDILSLLTKSVFQTQKESWEAPNDR